MLMSWASLYKTKKPRCLWSFLTLFSMLSSGLQPKGPSVSWKTTLTLDTVLPLSGSPGFWTIASVSNSGHVHSGWGLQKWLVEVSREMSSGRSWACGTWVFFSSQPRMRAQQMGTIHEACCWFLGKQSCSEYCWIPFPVHHLGQGILCVHGIPPGTSPASLLSEGLCISISRYLHSWAVHGLRMVQYWMPSWQLVSKPRWQWNPAVLWVLWNALTACSGERICDAEVRNQGCDFQGTQHSPLPARPIFIPYPQQENTEAMESLLRIKQCSLYSFLLQHGRWEKKYIKKMKPCIYSSAPQTPARAEKPQ